MINHTNHCIVPSILITVISALSGCGENLHQSPPKRQVQDAVAAVLPPFVSLDSIALEPISTGTETVKVNFKAIVVPKEDLYEVDREVEGTPKVTLLKIVEIAGTKASLYGSVEARRNMDKWMLDTPEIQIGNNQFGKPRGAFNAQSYVTGSDAAAAALKQQDENRIAQAKRDNELQKQQDENRIAQAKRDKELREERDAQKALEDKTQKEREEQARIAFEKQRQIEIEKQKQDEAKRKAEQVAAQQKLLLATVPGASYIGTITHENKIERLRLVFTEQKDFLLRAEASNPDNPKKKQTFTGELISNPQPEKGSNIAYPMVLSPVSEGQWISLSGDEFYCFYGYKSGSVKLLLTDKGLEGEAILLKAFTIRLQREGIQPGLRKSGLR